MNTSPSLHTSTNLDSTQEFVPLNYKEVGKLYGNLLSKKLESYLLLVKKWQDDDLIWPLSDLDFRIILKNEPISWIDFNEAIYSTHFRFVQSHVIFRRVLEHTPGFAFLKQEITNDLVGSSDIITWSCCQGPNDILESLKSIYIKKAWNNSDTFYYASIIENRCMQYQLPTKAPDNVVFYRDVYPAYSVCWHYFTPALFALTALSNQRRLEGKMSVLKSYEPALYFLETIKQIHHINQESSALLSKARETLDLFSSNALEHSMSTINNSTEQYTYAIAMLRCRLARYLYCLYPPEGVATENLILSETKQLRSIMQSLRNSLPKANSSLQRLINHVLLLFPNAPLQRRSIEDLINSIYRHKELFDEFLSEINRIQFSTI